MDLERRGFAGCLDPECNTVISPIAAAYQQPHGCNMRHLVAPSLCRYAQDSLGRIKSAEQRLNILDPAHPDAPGLRDAVEHHSLVLRDIEAALPPEILRQALAAEDCRKSDRDVLLAELRRRGVSS